MQSVEVLQCWGGECEHLCVCEGRGGMCVQETESVCVCVSGADWSILALQSWGFIQMDEQS